jgi:hypothetical protein
VSASTEVHDEYVTLLHEQDELLSYFCIPIIARTCPWLWLQIESTGALTAETIVMKAVEILLARINVLEEAVRACTATDMV